MKINQMSQSINEQWMKEQCQSVAHQSQAAWIPGQAEVNFGYLGNNILLVG